MRSLGYAEVERWEHVYLETIDPDFLLGHILSATSREQAPIEQRDEFAREVRAAISAAEASGRLVETVMVQAVIGLTSSHSRGERSGLRSG